MPFEQYQYFQKKKLNHFHNFKLKIVHRRGIKIQEYIFFSGQLSRQNCCNHSFKRKHGSFKE